MGDETFTEGFSANYVSIDDLFFAYRKAKADSFFERELGLHLEFLEYEERLEQNLDDLLKRLRGGDWMQDQDVLGNCVFIPKGIKEPSPSKNDGFGKTVFTNSLRAWNEQFQFDINATHLPEAEFRPIAKPSIEWLVISALWIGKAGHKLDACLSVSVYGSRLRRIKSGAYNDQALGCFAPYAPAYKEWREHGIRVIEQELDEGYPVVALTADLRSFYHSINPSFVLTTTFKELIAKCLRALALENPLAPPEELSEEDWKFTTQIVASMQNWTAKHYRSFSEKKDLGVPIGPSASRIIANLSLLAFDKLIEEDVQPLYYGRYVDDLFLVMRMAPQMRNGNDVWQRMQKLSANSDSGCVLSPAKEPGSQAEKVWRITLNYDLDGDSGLPKSNLRFAGAKQKVFFLEGLEGKALLNTIKRQIRLSSSEWRRLPEVPQLDEGIHADCLIAVANVAEPADNLRKADQISIRRLRFALHLRDIEALATDLEPADWEPVRKSLFEFARSHLTAPRSLFTYAPYLQRIFALGVKAGAWDAAKEFVEEINKSLDSVAQAATKKTRQLKSCRGELNRKLFGTLCCSIPHALFTGSDLPDGLKSLFAYLASHARHHRKIASGDLIKHAKQLLLSDLSYQPLRDRLLHRDPMDIGPVRPIGLPQMFREARKVKTLQDFLLRLDKGAHKRAIPPGMLFPTRPITPAEISFRCSDLLNPGGAEELSSFVQAIRGNQFGGVDPKDDELWRYWRSVAADDRQHQGPEIWIPSTRPKEEAVKVCLPCLMVNDESWIASVAQRPDPDLYRYTRLTRIINEVVRLPLHERPDYIVLPELSVKSRWFGRFAYKLEKSGISLIAGIEYEHSPREGIGPNEVINAVRVSLVTDYPGYRTHLVFSQNKETPALHEESELLRVSGKELVKGNHSGKKIIRHGVFQFGILICSELTNIEHRKLFRGTVDALFVPQWNKDIEGFAPLVESSSVDLHLFVVQCNNRRYGDCRIRAPYKELWERDVVRIKGGIHDYFSTGLIHFQELRRFQSCHRSPKSPFKPVPDGFRIHCSRSDLPLGEKEQ